MSNGIGVFFSTCCPHPHYGRQCPSQYFHLATSSCSLIFGMETMTKESEKPPKVSTRNAEGSSTGNVVRLRTNSTGQQQQSKEQSPEPDTPKKSSNNKSKSEKQSGSGGGGGGGGGGSSGGNSPSGRQQQDSQSQQSKRNMGPTNHSSSNSNSNGHQDDNGGGGGNNGGQVNGVRSQEPPPRNRCRCWCCCCSCSWLVNHCCLALRNNEENRPKPKEDSDLICDQDVPPTLEEIRGWGESFDKLMRSAAGRKVLREFLKCEYSEENILFWLACEDLKKESKPELIEEKARLIYEDYISILSPKEVSLDSRVREVVNQNMVDPSPHTFDEAQVQIYTLMHRDSYPRFVNSPLYKKLAQLQTTHRGSSVSASNPASRKESLVS